MTTHREKLYPLCDELARLALEIANQCELKVTARGFAEPNILALALLGRTLQNFKGCLRLVESELAVEARVLARCCYENMFMVGGLHAQGAKFADKMIEDDKGGRRGRIGFTFENEAIFQGLSEEMQKAVAQTKQELDAAPRPRFLKPKDISGLSAFKESYMAYSQFSGDAAHPTMMALSRHWQKGQGGEAFFDFIADPKPGELDETLHLTCIAVIGIMVVVNEMFDYTEAGKRLPELNGKFAVLQTEQYGPATIAEQGMEIRTERY